MRKKNLTSLPLFAVLLVMILPLTAMAQVPDFVTLAKQLTPAVVNISTTTIIHPKLHQAPGPYGPGNPFFNDFFNHFFQGQMIPHKEQALGSGFIISKDGYILTNDHVVKGADTIKVRLDKGQHSYTAKVIGVDPKLDIALLKIDAGDSLPTAKLGDSDKLQVGQWVMAIGNPFGLNQTVTAGIISAKGRVIGAGPYDDFLQTDASINPGNSGGPLIDGAGEVVGINTAIIAGGQGIGFAIPINEVKAELAQLKKTGHVVRGWLGVTVQGVSDSLAQSFGLKEAKGALISNVSKDSPAEKAGLKRGDIILSFAGAPIETVNDLPRLVAAMQVGKNVKMDVFRDGKPMTITVKVGRLNEKAAQNQSTVNEGNKVGLQVADVTPQTAKAYNLQSDQGALITGVDPAGPAADTGLQPGDLIIEVNSRSVNSADAFWNAVAKAKKGSVLRLLVERQGTMLYTTLTVQ